MLRAVRQSHTSSTGYYNMSQNPNSMQRNQNGSLRTIDPYRSQLRSNPISALRNEPITSMEDIEEDRERIEPKEMSKNKERQVIHETLSKMLFDKDDDVISKRISKLKEEREKKQQQHDDDDDSSDDN